jgi:hypothetical protein
MPLDCSRRRAASKGGCGLSIRQQVASRGRVALSGAMRHRGGPVCPSGTMRHQGAPGSNSEDSVGALRPQACCCKGTDEAAAAFCFLLFDCHRCGDAGEADLRLVARGCAQWVLQADPAQTRGVEGALVAGCASHHSRGVCFGCNATALARSCPRQCARACGARACGDRGGAAEETSRSLRSPTLV